MLPPFIIEQIRKREKEEREHQAEQPRLELPLERRRSPRSTRTKRPTEASSSSTLASFGFLLGGALVELGSRAGLVPGNLSLRLFERFTLVGVRLLSAPRDGPTQHGDSGVAPKQCACYDAATPKWRLRLVWHGLRTASAASWLATRLAMGPTPRRRRSISLWAWPFRRAGRRSSSPTPTSTCISTRTLLEPTISRASAST